jgi:L-arginine dehydrogenase
MPVLAGAQVAELINGVDVDRLLRKAFAGLVGGESVQPPQTRMVLAGGGDAIIYPAALQAMGVIGVKVSPYLPAATPPVSAWTLLMSSDTGDPILLCDSLALTTERTAATTALAVDLLAPKAARTVAIVGAGAVAAAHLRHIGRVRDFDEARVFSPSVARGDEAPRRRMSTVNEAVVFCQTIEDAIDQTDIVLLCTSSPTAVIDVDATTPSALITSISTDAPDAHEIPPGALPNLCVYCDYRITAPVTAGEMILAERNGVWSAEAIIADLPELVSGVAPPRPTGRAFFRSTGLGIEDAAFAAGVLRAYADRPKTYP